MNLMLWIQNKKDHAFLKMHIDFEINGKMIGKSNFEFAELCLKNSSRCFTNPQSDQVYTS